MKLRGLLALSLMAASGAVSAESLHVDRDKVWFKPTLRLNAAPICADVLRVEHDVFFGERAPYYSDYGSLKKIDGDAGDYIDPQLENVNVGYEPQFILARPNGRRVFVKLERFVGCGGACETERMRVADKLFDQSVPSQDETTPGTPRAPNWHLYKGPDGEFYALGIVGETLSQVYRLAGGASADLVCEVVLQPDELADHDNPAVRRVWQSVEALHRTYLSLSQGAGHCGSLQSHGRHQWDAEQAFQLALYRPWSAPVREMAGAGPELQVWALGGVAEYQAWRRHLVQVQQTTDELATFYRQQYSWPEQEAKQQAAGIVHQAIETGFTFPGSYYYDLGAADRPLRRAILERKPMDVIAQYEPNRDPPEDRTDDYDSILNVAIEYPEALQYLLSKGLDPNTVNEFGKTPLMYAAQYNQIESVRVLLAAGADPNAATHLPEDDCYYTLRTSGMTPLHYAARYASASVIRMFVAGGAATFNNTRNSWTEMEEYPLDWLKKHNGITPKSELNKFEPAPDRNPNISAPELPGLFELLRVPSDAARQQTSNSLVMRAQAEYARGEFRSAYHSLKLALSSQPTNEKALADLSLVASKAGDFRAAMRAARRGIESTSVSTQASAWFNLGLICELDEARRLYLRKDSCDEDTMWPFVQAWKLQPTRARAQKLRQLFDQDSAGSCSGTGGDPQGLKIRLMTTRSGQLQRIHILHGAGDSLIIEAEPGMERLIDNLAIQEQSITVIERPKGKTLPGIYGQACLMPQPSP